jgi:hypothetical protein
VRIKRYAEPWCLLAQSNVVHAAFLVHAAPDDFYHVCLLARLAPTLAIVGVRERIDIHTCVVNDGCAASDGGGNAGGAERHGCDRTSQSEGF